MLPAGDSTICPCLYDLVQVVIDQTAKAAYVVDGTNWIGTDVPETFAMKIEAARQRGLGGLMVRICLDVRLAVQRGAVFVRSARLQAVWHIRGCSWRTKASWP